MLKRVKGTPCLRVDARRPRDSDVRHAAAILKNGGVITLPTDTVYGLAVDSTNPAAVRRLYRLKGRDDKKPLACLLAYRQQALALSEELNDSFWNLAKQHWPGALTLVVARSTTVPSWLTAGKPSIGLRWPDCPWVWALAEALGNPPAVSSANLSGEAPQRVGERVNQQWGGRVDLLIDAGNCVGGLASSVVDCCRTRPRLLRAGPDAERLGL